MKIGMSLPYDFVLESPESDTALILKRCVGNNFDFLRQLRSWGLGSIELRGLEYETDKKIVEKISKRLWEMGFEISVHTSLPSDETSNPDYFLSFLENILPSITSFQKNLILVVHSYRIPDCSYETLMNKTVCITRSVAGLIKNNKLPLRIAIELNRGKKNQDPSTTYDGLLKLRKMMEFEEHVGFCWDMGHAYSNFMRGSIPFDLPEEFGKAVIHTHIHGVSEEDKTHCPLTPKNLPLGDWVSQLKQIEYNGVFNLEINPQEIAKENNAVFSIKNSVDCLRGLS